MEATCETTVKTRTKSKRASLRIRVMLLDALDAAGRPATVPELRRRLGPDAPHASTIARALGALLATGEVVKTKEPGRVARYSTG